MNGYLDCDVLSVFPTETDKLVKYDVIRKCPPRTCAGWIEIPSYWSTMLVVLICKQIYYVSYLRKFVFSEITQTYSEIKLIICLWNINLFIYYFFKIKYIFLLRSYGEFVPVVQVVLHILSSFYLEMGFLRTDPGPTHPPPPHSTLKTIV